jgi:hypothetical protein
MHHLYYVPDILMNQLRKLLFIFFYHYTVEVKMDLDESKLNPPHCDRNSAGSLED